MNQAVIQSKAGGNLAAAGHRLAPGDPGQRLSIERLLGLLADQGVISEETRQTLVRDALLSSAGRHPLVMIAERGLKALAPPHALLDLDWLCQWLAEQIGWRYVRIDPLKVDFSRIAEVMSKAYANRFRILPLELDTEAVTIATAEPYLTAEWSAELAHTLRRRVVPVLASPLDLQRYLVEFFDLAGTIRHAQRTGQAALQHNFEQLVELGRNGRHFDANDQHIVTLVDWLWQYAFEQRASDIHLEPRRDLGVVRFRIDGLLNNVYQVPPGVMSAMTSRIKLLGRMDVVEKRRPQDGRIKTRAGDGHEIELRLSTLPTAFGEKLVMRVFDPDVLSRDFGQLGLQGEDLARWQDMTTRPNGIVLVTGPTGSGKTTTLYATLRALATEEVNVSTIEDPIEMVENSFNQMQVQPAIDLGFADGIRALMRQDPDIIMVGEIRDLETAEMAVQAALTGHLVISTLHTNDAPSAITRLLDLGVPAYLLQSTLIGVMAQRLARTLCPVCRQPDDSLADEAWANLVSPFRNMPKPAQVYRPAGCPACRMSGFRGRTGLYEILASNDVIRRYITERPELRKLRLASIKYGMRPLRIAGAAAVAAGLTTIEEALRHTPPVEL
ncbi:MAG: ATPase, T2SS/T4P/T4SS family [Lautropia sp.]|nr:ATPase, T2SS/T4P/T4SS family [Lautropia sp.]